MDVVHKIENVEVKAADNASTSSSDSSKSNTEVSTPVETVKISSVTVDTQGVDYGLPNTLTPFDYMSWIYKQYGINKK